MHDSQAVIFDLDGTLLDTLQDIALAANYVFSSQGLPTHPADAFRQFVGEGVETLIRRALGPPRGDDEQLVQRSVEAFSSVYRRQWNQNTRVYPGVLELIDSLGEQGVPLAVLSNKPHEFTRLCVAEYFPRNCFREVHGQRPEHPAKPSPEGALRIADALGIDPGRCLLLGDTEVDIRTALAAGMEPVGVLWGFRSRAELVSAGAGILLSRPLDLLAHIGESKGGEPKGGES